MSGDLDRKDEVSEDHDYLGKGEDSDTPTEPVNKLLLNRSDVLAALQAQSLAALPPSVKKRIKALKKLQLESTKIESKFYEEIHALECKYHKLWTPQYEKRAQIISGKYEPTEDECDWDSDRDEEELSNDLEKKVKIKVESEDKNEVKNDDTKGIPEFWLTIFKNVSLLQEMMEEHDIPILKHLEDVKVIFNENPMGFILEFHFSPNEFFQNSVLTKEYEMKCTPDDSDPFSFEGPEIIKCKGCPIEWAKGKNVTIKTSKKKQKHKGRGEVRIVTKTVHRDSFFNFFSPPSISEDPDAEIDEETQSFLTADFEIGHYFKERIIPKAVLYYTGEALEDEEDEFEEEEGDDDSEDEEEDEDDPVFNAKNTAMKNVNPSECKSHFNDFSFPPPLKIGDDLFTPREPTKRTICRSCAGWCTRTYKNRSRSLTKKKIHPEICSSREFNSSHRSKKDSIKILEIFYRNCFMRFRYRHVTANSKYSQPLIFQTHAIFIL